MFLNWQIRNTTKYENKIEERNNSIYILYIIVIGKLLGKNYKQKTLIFEKI